MHGRTTSTLGTTTRHTASEAHGTGAVIMIHGTATHGTGTDGTAHIMEDGTVHTTMEDGMIRGITEDGTTHGTTEDITAIMDGTRTGDITITTTTRQCRSTTKSAGMETADRPALTECSPAECPQEAAWQAPAG